MSILMSAILLQAAAVAPEEPKAIASEPVKQESKICRDMLTSSTRTRPLKVCKTRAQWARWHRCHSATRYCAPPKEQTVTVASLPGDKLVCKYLKTTGSRIEQQKICATKRQWEITELETQEAMRDLQSSSTLASEISEDRGPGGAGPR